MLLVAVERELGEDGVTFNRYAVEDSVLQNKIDGKVFADLVKLPSPELELLTGCNNNEIQIIFSEAKLEARCSAC